MLLAQLVREWLIIVQLTTGQSVALDIASELECRETLVAIEIGKFTHITLEGGLVLPILRGVGCERAVDFHAEKARRGQI